jgi:hypothetical protein
MMVTNCLFRWGAAAILLSNKPGRRFCSFHASLATAQALMCTVVADIYTSQPAGWPSLLASVQVC